MIIPYKKQQIKNCELKFQEEWNKRFKCSFCENDFADLSGKRRHEKLLHINYGQLHKCSNCEKTYESKDSLKRHIKLSHKLNG